MNKTDIRNPNPKCKIRHPKPENMPRDHDLKAVISWSLYDWANSSFATTIMAGFFPVFLKAYWSIETDVSVSTFRLGAANSLASVIIVVLAPLLGAIADRGSAKKKFLLFFAALGIVMRAGSILWNKAHGKWPWGYMFWLR